MNLLDIIILSIALGVDCLVVSFTQGLIINKNKRLNSLLLAVSMGFFQGFMPFLSYFLTGFVNKYIEPFSKWLVFAIFMALGIKILIETFHTDKEKDEVYCLDYKCILGFGIATSIDALASGINLKLTSAPIISSALIIGAVSFTMSCFGFWFGYFFKKIPIKILGTFGGLILIFLAIKSLGIFTIN